MAQVDDVLTISSEMVRIFSQNLGAKLEGNGSEIRIEPTHAKKNSKAYVLKCPSAEEGSKWLTALRQATQPQSLHYYCEGWLTKKELCWFKEEQDAYATSSEQPQNTLSVNGCQIAGSGSVVEIKPGDPKAEVYKLEAAAEDDANRWRSALLQAQSKPLSLPSCRLQPTTTLSGWMMKKGDRRFFSLRGDLLQWFDKEDSRDENGHLVLTGSRVTGEGKLVEVGEYAMEAPNLLEAQHWRASLTMAAREKLAAKPTKRTLINDGLQGWLTKKGQKRFFVLSGSALYWMKTEPEKIGTELAPGWESKCKNSLNLAGCSVRASNQTTVTIGQPGSHSDNYDLICPSADVCNHWVEAVSAKRGYLVKKGKTRWFVAQGGSLMWFDKEVAPANEKAAFANGMRMLTPDVQVQGLIITLGGENPLTLTAADPADAQAWATIPTLVLAVTTEVEARGMEVEGIYRLSGNSDKITKWKHAFDDGASSLDQSEDIHTYTGLLKLYLRELPEPLLTFGLYEPLLRSQDITSLLRTLPVNHLGLLHHLVRHLNKVSQYSGQTHMGADNLAIVFGPTIMWRPDSDDQMVMVRSLADTPMVLSVVSRLISNPSLCPEPPRNSFAQPLQPPAQLNAAVHTDYLLFSANTEGLIVAETQSSPLPVTGRASGPPTGAVKMLMPFPGGLKTLRKSSGVPVPYPPPHTLRKSSDLPGPLMHSAETPLRHSDLQVNSPPKSPKKHPPTPVPPTPALPPDGRRSAPQPPTRPGPKGRPPLSPPTNPTVRKQPPPVPPARAQAPAPAASEPAPPASPAPPIQTEPSPPEPEQAETVPGRSYSNAPPTDSVPPPSPPEKVFLTPGASIAAKASDGQWYPAVAKAPCPGGWTVEWQDLSVDDVLYEFLQPSDFVPES